jgi:hypothetical protein
VCQRCNHLQAFHAELKDDGYDLPRLSADLMIDAEQRAAEHGARGCRLAQGGTGPRVTPLIGAFDGSNLSVMD